MLRWCPDDIFPQITALPPIWSTFPYLRNSEHSPLPHLHQTTDHQPMFFVALLTGVAVWCAVRDTLSGCLKYIEHAMPRILLTRLFVSIFGLAGSV